MKLPERMIPTIGNDAWITKNADALKKLFPETWTHMENFESLKFAFRIKVLGVEWREYEELATVMAILTERKILLKDGYLIKRAL